MKTGPKGAHRRTKAKKSHNLPRPFGEERCHFDEIWVYQYDPETKRHTYCTIEEFSTNKKFRRYKSRVKTILLTFYVLQGLDKQSTKLTIWKCWKGCAKKLDGNNTNFCQQLMDIASLKCACSHGTLCEEVFSY